MIDSRYIEWENKSIYCYHCKVTFNNWKYYWKHFRKIKENMKDHISKLLNEEI